MKQKVLSSLAPSALLGALTAPTATANPSFDAASCHGAQISSTAHFFGGVAAGAQELGLSENDGRAILREFFPPGSVTSRRQIEVGKPPSRPRYMRRPAPLSIGGGSHRQPPEGGPPY